jgi:energy-coupling factor transport system permease protein
LHPLTKLALTGFTLVLGLSLPGLWSNFLLVGLFLVPLALWGRLLGRLARLVWPVVVPFALSVFIIQGLFWQGGPSIASIGPAAIKQQGLAFAVASTGRILAVVAAFLLLTLSTRPDHLMIALTQRGFPPTISYIFLATIQIIPRFQARSQTILDAQQSRGLHITGRLTQRAGALIPLVIPLVLGSIVEVEQRAIALEARGFNRHGPKTSYRQLTDSRAQAVARAGLVVAIILVPLARVAVWLLS